MRVYVLLLCCVQVKLHLMTKSTVFLLVSLVARCPLLDDIINRCWKKMFGALLFTWAPLVMKKRKKRIEL